MPRITKTGRAFAATLSNLGALQGLTYGETETALETVSLFLRHARTFQAIQVARCNGCPAMRDARIPHATASRLNAEWEARIEAQHERLSERLAKLGLQIPGVAAVKLGGDPRGATVKLLLKSGRGDSWETLGDESGDPNDQRRFVCVPNRGA